MTRPQAAFGFFGQESAERLAQLVATAREMGEGGAFAAFAQHLKSLGDDYDSLIAENRQGT